MAVGNSWIDQVSCVAVFLQWITTVLEWQNELVSQSDTLYKAGFFFANAGRRGNQRDKKKRKYTLNFDFHCAIFFPIEESFASTCVIKRVDFHARALARKAKTVSRSLVPRGSQ